MRPTWTDGERDILSRVVARSAPMSVVLEQVRKIANAADTTVLLLGETGSGKELIARTIHSLSARKARPFIPIDCGSLPESLIESELFGYEKGAFTGASAAKPGKFELAQGGTIILDEVGELPLSFQAKLLRVLQERQVWRLGASVPRTLDIRVISATHRSLDALVAEGRFRQDLWYRLNTYTISLPALRDRGPDILHLADAMLDEFARAQGKPLLGFSAAAKAAMIKYRFPGNVRELRNVVEVAVVRSDGPYVEATDFPPHLAELEQGDAPLSDAISVTLAPGALGAASRAVATLAIARCGGNVTQAATLLGITRPALSRLIRKHGLIASHRPGRPKGS